MVLATLLRYGAVASAGYADGLGLARLRDLSDRVFRTSEQIESILEADCLAVFPKIVSDAKAALPQPSVPLNSASIEVGLNSRSSASGLRLSRLFRSIFSAVN